MLIRICEVCKKKRWARGAYEMANKMICKPCRRKGGERPFRKPRLWISKKVVSDQPSEKKGKKGKKKPDGKTRQG